MIDNKKEMFEAVDKLMRELFCYACNAKDMTEDEQGRLMNEIPKFYNLAYKIAERKQDDEV